MTEIAIRACEALGPDERAGIVALWNAEYPRQLAFADVTGLDGFLAGLGAPRHWLAYDGDALVGWLTVFTRDGATWFATIVGRALHGRGVGTALLARAQAAADVLHGWVIDHDRDVRADGSPYPSPLGFYRKLGFEVVPDVRHTAPPMSAVLVRWTRPGAPAQ